MFESKFIHCIIPIGTRELEAIEHSISLTKQFLQEHSPLASRNVVKFSARCTESIIQATTHSHVG